MSKLTDERILKMAYEQFGIVAEDSEIIEFVRAIEAELSAAPASQDWNAAIEAAYRAADSVLPFKDEKQRNPSNVRNEILNAINSLVRPCAQQEQDKDAERYRWIRHHLGAVRHGSENAPQWSVKLPPCPDNVMRGSVAGHLDAAIDAAISGSKQ